MCLNLNFKEKTPMKKLYAFMLLLAVSGLFVLGCEQSPNLLQSPLSVQNEPGSPTQSDGELALPKNSLPNSDYIKVFRTGGTMVIDGNESDWENVPKHKMHNYFDIDAPIDDKFDLSAYFKMLWDDNALYVFVNILDDNINVNAVDPWDKDSFELFIDADNSKDAPNIGDPPVWPGTYDGDDDQIRFVWQVSPFSARGNYDVSQFDYAYLQTGNGWNVEIKMPFSAIQMGSAADGHVFGVEFHVNDNDYGERHNFVKWWSESDYTYLYPSLFGTAYLFNGVAE
jgi:Carbohydrate family 9 binding domain-like